MLGLACRRLGRWLWSKRLNLQTKLNIWRSCVFSVLQYGLLSVGLSPKGIDRFQHVCVGMLRKIVGNHSYITRQTHSEALTHCRPFWPLLLLTKAARKLQTNLQNRKYYVQASDILHMLDWTHLDTLIPQLEAAQQSGALAADAPVTNSQAGTQHLFTCHFCSFSTMHVPSLHSHFFTQHGIRHGRLRSIPSIPPHFQGLPKCRHCHQAFTTWQAFNTHVERNVCQAPVTTELRAARIAKSMEPVLPDQMLQESDLAYLLHQHSCGHDIIRLISSKSWEDFANHREAMQFLSQHCILCGMRQSRVQNLHHHLRQNHAAHTDHLSLKAAQLFAAYGQGSPCKACGAVFKKHHTCVAWTQVAMLHLKLPQSITNQVDTQAQKILTCDICRIRFADLRHLTTHLKQHKLVIFEWRASRDSLNGTSACSHCQTSFATRGGLQQRIIFGTCKNFHEAALVDEDNVDRRWLNLMQTHVLQLLEQPSDCLELTAKCQCCHRAFAGARELGLHLQSQHGQVLRSAQSFIQFLNAVTHSMVGSLCQPPVKVSRQDRQCMPLVQLGMPLRNSSIPFWIPIPVDVDACRAWLATDLNPQHIEDLCSIIANRAFAVLWTDSAWSELLRTQCLHCAMHLEPAELIQHTQTHHPQALPWEQFLQLMLVPIWMALPQIDDCCHLCAQKLVDPAQARSSAIRRFQTECPVTRQIVSLIHGCASWGLAHGNPRGSADCRSQVQSGTPSLPTDGLQSGNGSKRQRIQTLQTGSLDADGARSCSVIDVPGSPVDGQAPTSPRAGDQHMEASGQLHHPFDQRAQRPFAIDDPDRNRVADSKFGQSQTSGPLATQGEADPDNLPGVAATLRQSDASPEGGPTCEATALPESSPAGRDMALSEMGSHFTNIGDGRCQDSSCRDLHAPGTGMSAGIHENPGQHHQMPCDEQQPGPEEYPLATSDPYQCCGTPDRLGQSMPELCDAPVCR